MKYTSISKNKWAVVFATLFGTLGAAFLLMAMLGLFFRVVFEVLALICAVALIQMIQKYLMSYYEYILDPSDELTSYNRLTVIQVTGKKRTSVYTAPLRNLTDVIPYKKMKQVTKEYGKIGTKMSFCPDMFPKGSCLLIFDTGEELTVMRLQCGAEFVSALKERKGF